MIRIAGRLLGLRRDELVRTLPVVEIVFLRQCGDVLAYSESSPDLTPRVGSHTNRSLEKRQPKTSFDIGAP